MQNKKSSDRRLFARFDFASFTSFDVNLLFALFDWIEATKPNRSKSLPSIYLPITPTEGIISVSAIEKWEGVNWCQVESGAARVRTSNYDAVRQWQDFCDCRFWPKEFFRFAQPQKSMSTPCTARESVRIISLAKAKEKHGIIIFMLLLKTQKLFHNAITITRTQFYDVIFASKMLFCDRLRIVPRLRRAIVHWVA